jgi:glyoxylase-like metal-dependent hydrolase (beta-lactamase superfamily II)
MKIVKFLTLGISALFALAACGDETSSTTAGTAGGGPGGAGGAGGSAGGAGGEGGSGGGAGGGGGGSAMVEVQTHTSPDGFAVDSHLVVGPTEAVLVDGQFFSAEAQKVVDLIKATNKKLTTVFLTHAHPDHYIGMEVIRSAYPNAQFVTTAKVLADYDMKKDATLAALQMAFPPGSVPDKVVTFTAVQGTSIMVDGYPLEVVEIAEPGESPVAAGLALKSMKAFIAGDLLYNQAHLWLAECDSAGWIKNLDTLAGMGFETFYPGHGAKGGAAMIAEDKKYIQDVQPLLDAAKNSNEAITNIKAAYPTWGGDGLLNQGTQNYFTYCK